jgi:hypothetical protein
MGMEKLSPTETALAVIVPDTMKVPPVDADQRVTSEYVSAVETLVQLTAAGLVVEPPEMVNVPVNWTRVVLPATFVVPAAPGAPVCNWT